jgi:steroid delta-isomerase-like uncharacterized protein
MSRHLSEIVNGLVTAWNSHDIERVVSYYAPEYVGHDVGESKPQHGPDDVAQSMTRYLRAFPDLKFMGEDTVMDGRRVALAWRVAGTHQGPLANIPASGRTVDICGVSWLVIEHGQVVRGRYIYDSAGLLRAIGLLPEL